LNYDFILKLSARFEHKFIHLDSILDILKIMRYQILHKNGDDMLETGTRIKMTKGYKGVKGVVIEKTDSQFEFYIVRLDNGISIIVGPSAFTTQRD
jgi:hypothetical protein